MSDYFKKIREKLENIKEKLEAPDVEKEVVVKKKFPIIDFIFKPFNLFCDNYKKMLTVVLIYGVLLSLVSFIFGYPYACSFGFEGSGIFYCSEVSVLYIGYLFVKMLVASSLMITVYGLLVGEDVNILRDTLSIKKNVKSFLILLVFLAMMFFPIISLYALYIREPNPDFRIETLFFAFASIGFLLPFVAMRFFALYPDILYGEKISMKYIWEKTKGKLLHILVSLFLIMFASTVVYRGFHVATSEYENIGAFHVVLFSEYIYSTIFALIFVLVTIHIYAQKTMIVTDDEDEDEGLD